MKNKNPDIATRRLRNLIVAVTIVSVIANGILYSTVRILQGNVLQAQRANEVARVGRPMPPSARVELVALIEESRPLPPEPTGPIPRPPSTSAVRSVAPVNSADPQRYKQLGINAKIDQRYGPFFKRLAPSIAETIRKKLIDRDRLSDDILTASRDQGLDMTNPSNRAAVNDLLTDARRESDTDLRQTLGDDISLALKAYERTLPLRETVNKLAQRLSATSEPLQPDQAEQLVAVLAAARPPGAGRALLIQGGVMFDSLSPVAVQQAQSVLTASQNQRLSELQQEFQSPTHASQVTRSSGHPSSP